MSRFQNVVSRVGRGDLSPTSGATPPDISAIPRTASNQNYNDSSTASLNKSAGAGALLDDASSDEGELGASQIDSFVTDHEAEIARLKTVLRERKAELSAKTQQVARRDQKLGDQEKLLRESKEIIDSLIEESQRLKQESQRLKDENHRLKASASGPSSRAGPAESALGELFEDCHPGCRAGLGGAAGELHHKGHHPNCRHAAPSPAAAEPPPQSPRYAAAIKTAASVKQAGLRMGQPNGPGRAGALTEPGVAVIQNLVAQSEATMTHVVGRVAMFKEAEEALLIENTELQAQLEESNELAEVQQVQQRESQAKVASLEAALSKATDAAAVARGESEATNRQIAERHNTVLQKYSGKKQENHTMREELLVLQEKLRQASGRVDDGCRRAEEETAARRELTEELERARAKASEFGGAQLQAAEEIRQAAAEQARAAREELAAVKAELTALKAQHSQLSMVRRLDHSQQQRHAAVVARTMETLGSIIEKTTNISSAAADPPLSSSRGSGQPAELRRRGEGRARRGEGELLASRAGANGAQWHSVASGGNGFSELSDREIVGQLCAHLDLPNRSDLLPFGIRVGNLLAFGSKLQAFVSEVRELAAGESDAAALQKLRRWPAERAELRRLRAFENSLRSLLAKRALHGAGRGHRPGYNEQGGYYVDLAGFAARAQDPAGLDGGTGQPGAGGLAVETLEESLCAVAELLHFEISAVELRAAFRKAEALLVAPDGLSQSLLLRVQQLVGAGALTQIIPTLQSDRLRAIETDTSKVRLCELLRLPASADWDGIVGEVGRLSRGG